ncbi:serine O-acetyltransferase EpsC [Pedobacter sp. P351]|uniref:serine O-acetyltransferase EpsC n=1 Tax=Pedobacter superstes TaxID=3133441 RepID=UPI0030A9F97A
MNKEFYQHIFDKHQHIEAVPSNKEIAGWAIRLIRILYPEQFKQVFLSLKEIEDALLHLQEELCHIMNSTKACQNSDNEEKAKVFFKDLPLLYSLLNTDIEAILAGDPAATSEFEIIRAYPGFYAISFFRLAHALFKLDIPLIPRILTEYAHSKTGIDIHPGAEVGKYLYIDHGTGIVIGGTAVIGNNVKFYQGVTLGALSVDKSMASLKRHPTVEDNVVIYAGATILGGETVIGHNSIIGGNVWLTKSVAPYSTVYHESKAKVIERQNS